LLTLRPALFVTRSAPGNVVAIAACIERLKIPGVRPNIGLRQFDSVALHGAAPASCEGLHHLASGLLPMTLDDLGRVDDDLQN
jgi:hypothetical protein